MEELTEYPCVPSFSILLTVVWLKYASTNRVDIGLGDDMDII